MGWFTRWRLRLRSLFQRKRVDAELQFYLEHVSETHIRAGVSRAEARAAAQRSMGSLIRIKEAVRDTRGLTALDHLVQDCRSSVRTLTRERAFSLVVIVIVALGIGINTGVFSLVHTVLLRRLPVNHPEELIWWPPHRPPGPFRRRGTTEYGKRFGARPCSLAPWPIKRPVVGEFPIVLPTSRRNSYGDESPEIGAHARVTQAAGSHSIQSVDTARCRKVPNGFRRPHVTPPSASGTAHDSAAAIDTT